MHFHAGTHPVAFAFSAPGALEKLSGKPVTGDTGVNLEKGLVYLAAARPDIFPTAHKHDYRITNAFSAPLAKSLGHKRTEASRGEVVEASNIARVQREVQGTRYVVLCGTRPEYLKPALVQAGFKVIALHIQAVWPSTPSSGSPARTSHRPMGEEQLECAHRQRQCYACVTAKRL